MTGGIVTGGGNTGGDVGGGVNTGVSGGKTGVSGVGGGGPRLGSTGVTGLYPASRRGTGRGAKKNRRRPSSGLRLRRSSRN